jgi:hypothetical protein
MNAQKSTNKVENQHTETRTRHKLRTRRRYRLSFINENTFNEVWTIKMSQRKVVISIVLIFVALGCMAATLIVFTPLRTLLPGYLKQAERRENVVNLFRVDSLLTSARENSEYLTMIGGILRGDSIALSAAERTDPTAISPDSLLPASDAERRLVRAVEERRQFTVDSRATSKNTSIAFHFPVAGAQPIAESTSTEHLEVRVARNAVVTSPAPATVVHTSYSPGKLWTVVLQHPNGYLTRITGLSAVTVASGKRVATDESIGTTGSAMTLGIELWCNGTPLDPLRFMPL